jgi:hypothetical protein
MQQELYLMGKLIPDEQFVMITIMTLPDSWDNFTQLFMGMTKETSEISSQELTAILIQEERHWKDKETGGTALQVKRRAEKGKLAGTKDKECYNCHKKGHISKNCWAKGGGKEGQRTEGAEWEKQEQSGKW